MRLVENSSLHVYKPFQRITEELLLQIQTQNKTILRCIVIDFCQHCVDNNKRKFQSKSLSIKKFYFNDCGYKFLWHFQINLLATFDWKMHKKFEF